LSNYKKDKREEKVEKKPKCPFCETELEKQQYVTDLIEKYKCPACNTEVKHPLIRPEKKESSSGVKHPVTENCEDCMQGKNVCDRCGDTVCDKHYKSVFEVASKFSKEQRDSLLHLAKDSENVCLTCMMAIISGVKQQNIELATASVERKYSKRRFPWLIFLPILILIAFLMSKVACK
jgi:hypothetical protein